VLQIAAHCGLKIQQNSRFENRVTGWTIIETVHRVWHEDSGFDAVFHPEACAFD